MEYSKERKNQMRTGFDSVGEAQLQVRRNGRIKNNLYGFIPKSMGFSQSLLKVPAGGDFLRASELRLKLGQIRDNDLILIILGDH